MSDLDTIELNGGKGFDLRLKRTYKLLVDSLFKLLREKSFDDITVIDLCDDAMVNRATFYKHFEDKYDFVECIAKNTLTKMYSMQIEDKNITEPNVIYHIIISNVVKFINDNREIFKISLQSSASGKLLNTLSDIIFKYIRELIVRVQVNTNRDLNGIPVDVIATFLNGGAVHIIRWWLFEGDEYSVDDLISFIEKIVLGFDSASGKENPYA